MAGKKEIEVGGKEIDDWEGKTSPKGRKEIELGGKEIDGWEGKTSPKGG